MKSSRLEMMFSALTVIGVLPGPRDVGKLVPTDLWLHEMNAEACTTTLMLIGSRLSGGPKKGARPDNERFDRAKRLYYRPPGWDEKTGWPAYEKLLKLGVDWIAELRPEARLF